jgi:hypoxanthine phosphoribosyltransferase
MLKQMSKRTTTDGRQAMCVLYDEADVQRYVRRLARKVHLHYAGEPFTMVGILHACAPFMFDLMRSLPYPVREQVRYDFFMATSRDGTKCTGVVKIAEPSKFDLKGRNILVVEGIVATGLTLSEVLPRLEKRRPKSIKVCALLDKPEVRDERFRDIRVDFCGTVAPPEFVVGYGFDLDNEYRGLPYIATIK